MTLQYVEWIFIRDSIRVDIGYAFKDECNCDRLVYSLANFTKDNIASNIKKMSKPITKSIAKVNETFEEFNSESYE